MLVHEEIVNEFSAECGLDNLMVQAIIQVESSGCTYATRFEPNWKYFYKVEEIPKQMKPRITYNTERVHQMTSWGLMQVMGSVAREHGFYSHLPMLCLPEIGIKYGCKHLAKLKRKDRTVADQVASYNAGSPRRLANGLYVNQVYVDKVFDVWKTLREQTQNLP